MKTHHTNDISMKTHYTDLIHGDFSRDSAKTLLFDLIQYKINFHHLQEFSDEERNGEISTHSKKRMEELAGEKEALKDFLDALEVQDQVRINCIVTLQTI
ncbi:hypothetical protein FLLO111716_13695 [Flavobacterium longum]|uniref:hypothetical protein n=1 Tax=Flavobacterium longum TaxID=1299340 RepID=UPI0039E93B2A